MILTGIADRVNEDSGDLFNPINDIVRNKRDIVLAKVNLIIVTIFIIAHSIRWLPSIFVLIWVRRILAIYKKKSSHCSFKQL